MEFLRSVLRRHFAGKPVLSSRNVGCFLRLLVDLATGNLPIPALPSLTSVKSLKKTERTKVKRGAKKGQIASHLQGTRMLSLSSLKCNNLRYYILS